MKLLHRCFLPLLLAVSAAALGSCGPLIGWIYAKSNTTETVEAEYEVPEGKTILVLADSALCETDRPIARMLTDRLNSIFEEEKIAAETISYEDLLDLAAVTPRFGSLKPARVGQKLGADIVCYIRIDEFRLKDQNIAHLWRGHLEVTVSMVDVRTGKQLWPMGEHEGRWIKPVKTPMEANSTPNYSADLAKGLCNRMAEKVAQLFYDHEIPRSAEPDKDNPLMEI